MALITCPECGHMISDSAPSCPSCGYSIKAELEKKKHDELLTEQKRQHEEKVQKAINQLQPELDGKLKEVDEMPYPEQPSLLGSCNGFMIGTFIFTVVVLIAAIALGGGIWIFAIAGVVVSIGAGLTLASDYNSAMSNYVEQTADWEKYKRERKASIRREYASYAENLARYGTRVNMGNIPSAPHQTNNLKCPVCGSRNVQRISTLNRGVSVAAVGLASSKIGKQYECKACKHKW